MTRIATPTKTSRLVNARLCCNLQGACGFESLRWATSKLGMCWLVEATENKCGMVSGEDCLPNEKIQSIVLSFNTTSDEAVSFLNYNCMKFQGGGIPFTLPLM